MLCKGKITIVNKSEAIMAYESKIASVEKLKHTGKLSKEVADKRIYRIMKKMFRST